MLALGRLDPEGAGVVVETRTVLGAAGVGEGGECSSSSDMREAKSKGALGFPFPFGGILTKRG